MALLIRAIYPEPVMVVRKPGDPPLAAATVGEKILPANGKDFTLDELYRYVGSPIDISTFPDGRMMVLNDEGKLTNLPVNVEATVIYREAWKAKSDWAAADTIVGDVLLCEAGEVS